MTIKDKLKELISAKKRSYIEINLKVEFDADCNINELERIGVSAQGVAVTRIRENYPNNFIVVYRNVGSGRQYKI